MENNLKNEIKGLIQEQVYLGKERKRLETVIDALAKRVEIENRMKEIDERLLEINISSLKNNHEKK